MNRSHFQIVLAGILFLFFFSCPVEKIPVFYAIGDTGPSGVGIVFYVTDGGLHGLEAAPDDQPMSVWSTIVDAYANGSSPLPSGIGTGSANTDAIILQNSNNDSAAKLCRDYDGGGKTDWFLPSSDELGELYAQQNIVCNFSNVHYHWSSSEVNENLARNYYFGDGIQYNGNKSNNSSVRPIRAF
jgi:hypothetical protein